MRDMSIWRNMQPPKSPAGGLLDSFRQYSLQLISGIKNYVLKHNTFHNLAVIFSRFPPPAEEIYGTVKGLYHPVNNLIFPFFFKGRSNFNIIIGITFHHAIFIYMFKQNFSGLPNVLLCK